MNTVLTKNNAKHNGIIFSNGLIHNLLFNLNIWRLIILYLQQPMVEIGNKMIFFIIWHISTLRHAHGTYVTIRDFSLFSDEK